MLKSFGMGDKQHITATPGVCGGRPCVAGTRIRVQDIVLRTEAGASPDEILASLPHITLADIYAALTYYYDNRDAIDAQIAESDQRVIAFKSSGMPAAPIGE
jgi:uncharacterized protein (DUF433 family)